MKSLIKKRWYLVAGVLILIAAGFYFKSVNDTRAKANKTIFTIKKQTVKDEISLSGQIEAEEHVTLRFQSSGRLSWVGAKEGDYVKKFQTIASLDQREVQQNLKKYLNTYMDSRLDYDQELEDANIKYTGGLTGDARRAALRVLDQAQFDLNNSVIDVELKKLAID